MARVHLKTISHFKGQLNSYEVIMTYFPVTLNAKELERRRWSRYVCFAETHRYICSMAYLGHDVTLTFGQISTLTFQGQPMHILVSLEGTTALVAKSLTHFSYLKKYAQ